MENKKSILSVSVIVTIFSGLLGEHLKRTFATFALTITIGFSTLAQNRVVLIEQFTNSSCPPCGAYSPYVYAYANNNPGVAVIAYHTLFPYNNDSMYFENPTEATQRVSYYSVVGVPNSVLDGNVYNGATHLFTPNISTLVNSRLSIAPRYKIEANSLSINGNQLSGSFYFTSLDVGNSSENLIAQVVIIEKNVLKSSYAASPGANNETEYGYVMRKMIPNSSGTSLTNTSLNASETVPLNWTLNHIKDKNELRVVAFVQNTSTKEIYQAELFNISEMPVGIIKPVSFSNSVNVYPNPVQNELNISFEKQMFVNSITILNPAGQVVYKKNLNANATVISENPGLTNGIYFMKVVTSEGEISKKLVVLR